MHVVEEQESELDEEQTAEEAEPTEDAETESEAMADVSPPINSPGTTAEKGRVRTFRGASTAKPAQSMSHRYLQPVQAYVACICNSILCNCAKLASSERHVHTSHVT